VEEPEQDVGVPPAFTGKQEHSGCAVLFTILEHDSSRIDLHLSQLDHEHNPPYFHARYQDGHVLFPAV